MSAEPGHTAPYSPDIGWRVAWQRLGMELGFHEIARNLNTALSTAYRIFKKFEETAPIQRKS